MKWFTVSVVILALCCGCTESPSPDTALKATAPGVRVGVAQPQRRTIDHTFTALGSVESIQDPTISAESSGQVVSIGVSEGDTVTVQQLMATIDDTLYKIEADKAAAELRRQEILLDNQQREVNRLLQLAKSQSISRNKLEDEQAQLKMLAAQLDVAKKQKQQALYLESKTRIVAPQSGIVAKRNISLGDYVTPGQALFMLVSVDILRARIAFPEHQAASISIGKQVKLKTPSAPGTIAIGSITSINPQINPRSRALDVIVEFSNPGGWYPGASVNATLIFEQSQDALTVPALSVVRRTGNDVVFVVKDGHASQRTVKLGWREDDWIEIVDGVTAGDLVVTGGAALITNGSLLDISVASPSP